MAVKEGDPVELVCPTTVRLSPSPYFIILDFKLWIFQMKLCRKMAEVFSQVRPQNHKQRPGCAWVSPKGELVHILGRCGMIMKSVSEICPWFGIWFKCEIHFSSQGEVYVHPEKGLEAGGDIDRWHESGDISWDTYIVRYRVFLATLVALHFTPVSKSVGRVSD